MDNYKAGEKQRYLSESNTLVNASMQPSFDRKDKRGFIFWFTVVLSQIVGIGCIVAATYWGTFYGGFDVTDKEKMFNFHPLFMIVGLVFCYGDAIIIYRVFSSLPKWILKIMHATLHICAIIFSSLALVAVFENHRRTNRAHMFSLHSWIGIATFGTFCLQYVGSFIAFLYPGLPNNWRARIMPFHTFFGVGIFIMAVATAGMGMTEKLLWTPDYTSNKLVTVGVIGNSLGLLVLVFAFLIVFLATHSVYKRKPLLNETASATVK